MAKNLDTYIVQRMVVLAIVVLLVMYLGFIVYFFVLIDVFPQVFSEDKWQISDFVSMVVILATGVTSATLIGTRLARNIVEPLRSVAAAARAITGGDFSARAGIARKPFGEAGDLIADFNTMAERLAKAEAELKYANSSIAHELRTPLTILRGRLQGLLDGAYQPEPALYSRLIAHVDGLSTIVEDLQALALINVGQLALEPVAIDLAEEAETILASTAQELAQAGITVVRRLEPAEATADRARIRQVLLAMLDNCRRYAPDSRVVVQTGTRAGQVFLRCSDNGPGLPAEDHERAFDRFWRADDSRTRARGGSGLGLPVIRGIARAHGGEARIIATDAAGLTVELTLPGRIPGHATPGPAGT